MCIRLTTWIDLWGNIYENLENATILPECFWINTEFRHRKEPTKDPWFYLKKLMYAFSSCVTQWVVWWPPPLDCTYVPNSVTAAALATNWVYIKTLNPLKNDWGVGSSNELGIMTWDPLPPIRSYLMLVRPARKRGTKRWAGERGKVSKVEKSGRNMTWLMILCPNGSSCYSLNLQNGQDEQKSRAMQKKGDICMVEKVKLVGPFSSSLFLYFHYLYFSYFPHVYYKVEKGSKGSNWCDRFPHQYFAGDSGGGTEDSNNIIS